MPRRNVFDPLLTGIRKGSITRDQLMLLMMAVNMLFMGVDTYLAHNMSGTIRPYERIPIIFGITACLILIAAGAFSFRHLSLAVGIGAAVYLASIAVGLLGTYFHLQRAATPLGLFDLRDPMNLLVWAPPALAPLSFCLVGWIGLSAIWLETPKGSGEISIPGRMRLVFPYSKTHGYFLLVGLGILISLLTSTLDHARTGYANPWLLIPLAAGIFGTIISVTVGLVEHPSRGDILIYAVTMVILILVGLVGGYLHLRADLTAQSQIVLERFLRGAPLLAPFLFANFGMLGLIALFGMEYDSPIPFRKIFLTDNHNESEEQI